MQLSNLSSLGKKRKRIGRGGSRGGTSGRGSKGQKARLGNGSIDKKLNVQADAFSKSAKEAIEKVGGKALLTKEM